jgi:hypothetical protein
MPLRRGADADRPGRNEERRKVGAMGLEQERDLVAQRDDTRLRRDSDALLEGIDEMRSMESEKRQHPISTDEFHELADAITDKSREIFAIAAEERVIGNRTEREPDRTTEDIDPGPDRE